MNITKTIITLALAATILPCMAAKKAKPQPQLWPDGTEISAWFSNDTKVDPETLGKKYNIVEHGVKRNNEVQTAAIQAVIDKCAANGGGLIVVPTGMFTTGSLFFPQGVSLYLEEGGMLRGSDRIRDFKLLETRMEGQTLKYFAALVNADHNDGFTICGKGTLDGNGMAYWEEFWIRRQYNRECTNLEAMRPRLVYISNCKDVTVQDVHLQNSPFWTNHLYRCERVRYIDAYIYAPMTGELKAPSSDAIDLDVCKDVLIKRCYMSVNDDAVVLKGGKGTWADTLSVNGPNSNIIVEDCNYGPVHSAMTLGSESIHDRNVILRNCTVDGVSRVLWLKMRPDTPQHYEYVTVDGITGTCKSMLVVKGWTQFFKPGDRENMPTSQCNNITIRNCKIESDNFFDVAKSDKYILKDFTFENCEVKDKKNAFNQNTIENTVVKGLNINGTAY